MAINAACKHKTGTSECSNNSALQETWHLDFAHHLTSLWKKVYRTGTCLSTGTRLLQLFLRGLSTILPSLYLMTERSIFHNVEVEKTQDDR